MKLIKIEELMKIDKFNLKSENREGKVKKEYKKCIQS